MTCSLKDNIHFIFVRTQFASNLGSSVRVMKNMGFNNLILIQPECEVGMEARSYAMKGEDILESAVFIPTLEEAADKLGVLIGTTARYRGKKQSVIDCRTLSKELLPRLSNSTVGIVFGSETNGLLKDELPFCQWLVEIPTESEYPVLNLAQSTAILSYELNLAFRGNSARARNNLASSEEIDVLVRRTEEVLNGISSSNRLSVEKAMSRLDKIIRRADLERDDVKLLHGLIKEIDRSIRD